MGVDFEEDKQYSTTPIPSFSAPAGGLTAFFLRIGVVKTESAAHTLAIALAAACFVLAAIVYFSFGRTTMPQAIPEELINTPQPTQSLS